MNELNDRNNEGNNEGIGVGNGVGNDLSNGAGDPAPRRSRPGRRKLQSRHARHVPQSQRSQQSQQETELELEHELQLCVNEEHEKTVDVLRYLREVQRKKVHLKRAYPSLFAYCTKKLRYSSQAANLRIRVMRLMVKIPGVEERIARRTLCLSVASLIYGVIVRKKLGAEDAAALVRDFSGLTKRQAEEELARRYPERPRPERKRFVDAEHTEIRFTLNREECRLIEQVLDLRAHSNYHRSYKELLLSLARKEFKKFQGKPRQDASPQRPEGPGNPLISGRRNRHVPAAVKRLVWRRDEGRCQFHHEGKICGVTHGVQLDHIHPYAEGGPHTVENLRLYCGAHNRLRSEERK